MPETPYFEGIDIKSATGQIISSVDVADTEARNELDDMANFIGYLSYLDGVNYYVNGGTPKLMNGRFWTNWNQTEGIVPVDNNGNTLKVDWSKDWEIGYALLMKDEIIRTAQTCPHGTAYSVSYWCKAPVAFIAHTNYISDPYATFTLRVSATTLTDTDLWEPNTGFEEGILPDIWYFIKASYNSSTHTASITVTKDFETWSTPGSVTQADKTPYTGSDDYLCFGGHRGDSGQPASNVILDLANTYVKQNGLMVWGHFDGKFAGEHHYQNPAESWKPLNDGYSNFWFELTNDTLSPWLKFSAKTNNAVIDWGDGSGEVALDTLSPTHTYSKPGRYIVKVKGVTGFTTYQTAPYGAYSRIIKGIEFANEVTSLYVSCFRYCTALKNISFGTGITEIPTQCFQNCVNIEKLIIPSNVVGLGNNCFMSPILLNDLQLNEGLTIIDNSAFVSCTSLRSIRIPSTVTSIGTNAFATAVSASEIHIAAVVPPTIATNSFTSMPSNYVMYVPVGTGETYKAASGWSTYADHIVEEGQTL